MMKKTAVSARARLLPAIAALCVTGVVSARAENAPATTPPATAAQGAQPATTPAAPPAAQAKVEDPSAKLTAPAAPGSAPATAPVAAAPAAATPATTTPAATAATTPAAPAAAPPAATAATTPPAAPAATATPAPAAAAPGATTPAAAATPPAAPGAAPNSTAALPDPVTGAAAQPAQVIPPADPVVAGIRTRLPELGKRAGEEEAAALAAYYGQMTGTPVWASTNGLTDKGKAVVSEISRAENWGLPASAFELPSAAAGTQTAEAAAEMELQVALAVLKYARYARGGRINPASISQLMDQQPTLVPPKTVLTDIAAAAKPEAYLQSLHPKHPQFEALRQVLLKLRGGEIKEEVAVVDPALAVKLPMGGVIRPGATDPQIALLRQRLKVTADDPANENVYDEKLQQAVVEFQRANSLRQDGIIGNGTRQVMNGGPAPAPPATNQSKIDRILINMERWRWVPADLGEFHVWDNVPEFLTRIVKNGKVIHTDEIIVGQPSWPTPMFSADMKTIVFRPSWGVPSGIKAKELAPLLRKSSGAGFFGIFGGGYSAQAVLDAYDLRVYAGNRQVDPNSVDWANVNIQNYSFQQPPGPKNPLGDVKFMFPNSHDVYMHDTPERNLFAKSFRALSHGCMRVHEPRRFAELLLAEDKGWSAEKVGSMFSGGEVQLDKHIPVHVTYITMRVDDNGQLQTYGDFYGLDGRTAAALTGKSIRFEQPAYPADDVVAASDDGPIGQSQQQYNRRKKKQASNSGPTTLSDAIQGLFSP